MAPNEQVIFRFDLAGKDCHIDGTPSVTPKIWPSFYGGPYLLEINCVSRSQELRSADKQAGPRPPGPGGWVRCRPPVPPVRTVRIKENTPALLTVFCTCHVPGTGWNWTGTRET